MLWRLTYWRDGAQRRLTFFAADLVAALEWRMRWERWPSVTNVEGMKSFVSKRPR